MNASGSDCSAANNMSLHIEDRVTYDQGYLWFTTSAKQTAVAMGDFNLDGFEDLFIMNDTELFAATAKTKHPVRIKRRWKWCSILPMQALNLKNEELAFLPALI